MKCSVRKCSVRKCFAGSSGFALSLVVCMGLSSSLSRAEGPVDPVKLMPASTFMYLSVDVDAGKKFLDQLKTTRLGKDFQKSIDQAKKKDTDTKDMEMVMTLVEGFGHHAGLGLLLPANLKATSEPDVVLVAPVDDMEKVRSSVDVISRMAAKEEKWTWKAETEGQNAVHVASGTVPAGQSLPAYSLVEGAFILGSSGPVVHSVLKAMDTPGQSLADSTKFQAMVGGVDRSQFLWGFVNNDPRLASMASTMGKAPDPNTQPEFKAVMTAYQGAAFSMALHPNSLVFEGLVGYDPETTLGKAVRQWESTPLKAPGLAFGHSLAFIDVSDMPHFAAQYNLVVKPALEMLMGMAEKSGTPTQLNSQLNTFMQSFNDIINSSGNEMALNVGPVNPANPIPPVTLMIENSDNPKLQKGINSILDLLHNVLGLKWFSKPMESVQVRVLGPPESPIRPSYARIGDFHVLALDLDAIKTPLFLSKAPTGGRSLAASTQFQQIRDLLGTQTIGSFYLDLHSIFSLVQDMAPKEQVQKARAMPGADVGLELVNDLRLVGATWYPNAAGLGSRMVVTFDPDAAPPAQGGGK